MWINLSTVLPLALLAAGAQDPGTPGPTSPDPLLEASRSRFAALVAPAPEAVQEPRAVLGRALFWDTRLSADRSVACASCHTREAWGSDSRERSLDARGKLTSRHSQTVFNALLLPGLRWRADRDSGAAQAEGSITGSMGFSAKGDVVPVLAEYGYEPLFRAAWPADEAPLTPRRYAEALEAYQATLITPARFDRFLGGDSGALDPAERSGLALFMELGCADCHSGALLGGERLRRFGRFETYAAVTGREATDLGLEKVTGKEEDRHVFRTAPLRNIARTAPYFHDGAVAELDAAVQVMARTQLGEALPADDVRAIVAFLGTLTGEVPAHYAPPAAAGGG